MRSPVICGTLIGQLEIVTNIMGKASKDSPTDEEREGARRPSMTRQYGDLPPTVEAPAATVPPTVRDEDATRPFTPRRGKPPPGGDFVTQRTPLMGTTGPVGVTAPASPAARAATQDTAPAREIGEPERESTSEWRFDTALQEQQAAGEDSHVIGGRYRILEGVAMGGMGAVFKVRHLTLGKEFALKIIHQAMSDDSQMLKFFTREAQVLSKLDHPGIVRITDFGHDERFGAYLVMEYLVGETLHARLARQGRLSPGPALTVALQIAEALHHMHSAEIIHCDIKPENIFLVRQPDGSRTRIHAKIIDFGLSKNMASGARLNVTEIGGTPIYAAPEQLQGLSPQPSMDIYAMGELLYHMLSGAPPFHGITAEICSQKLTDAAPPLSETLDKAVDENLESLVMKALERQPDLRQTSMAQVVFEMRTVMDMLGVGTARRARKAETGIHPRTPAAVFPETQSACERCPVPVFFTDGAAKITSANPACARFLKADAADLVGQTLGETRMGNVYPSIDEDVAAACAQGTPSQRLVTYQRRDNQSTTLLVWLVPQPGTKAAPLAVWGMIVPLEPGLI